MLQLQVSDKQFYHLLSWVLYYIFNGIYIWLMSYGFVLQTCLWLNILDSSFKQIIQVNFIKHCSSLEFFIINLNIFMIMYKTTSIQYSGLYKGW